MSICSVSINLSSVPFSAGKPGRYSYQKRCEYALKSGIMKNSTVQNIPPQPLPTEDEVVTIATRLSEVFLSNSTYPQKYFENIASVRMGETVGKYFHSLSPCTASDIVQHKIELNTEQLFDLYFYFTFPEIKSNYILRVSWLDWKILQLFYLRNTFHSLFLFLYNSQIFYFIELN